MDNDQTVRVEQIIRTARGVYTKDQARLELELLKAGLARLEENEAILAEARKDESVDG